jgi:hypothetical protein
VKAQYFLFSAIVGGLLLTAAAGCANAADTGSLTVTAAVDSSATLTLTDTSGPVTGITFSGAGNEVVTANEGAITVNARVSTTLGNTGTVIQVEGTDLTGETPGNVLPASDISYTHTTDFGGGTWLAGPLSNNWSTLAELTPGSGLYSGDQLYSLTIPASANDDTYTGTISYRIIGF